MKTINNSNIGPFSEIKKFFTGKSFLINYQLNDIMINFRGTIHIELYRIPSENRKIIKYILDNWWWNERIDVWIYNYIDRFIIYLSIFNSCGMHKLWRSLKSSTFSNSYQKYFNFGQNIILNIASKYSCIAFKFGVLSEFLIKLRYKTNMDSSKDF